MNPNPFSSFYHFTVPVGMPNGTFPSFSMPCSALTAIPELTALFFLPDWSGDLGKR